MSKLQVKNLTLSRGEKQILKNQNLQLNTGELVVVLGANGAGKTSLLRCAAGLEPDANGDVRINETAISHLTSTERAKQIAYLPQKRPIAWPLRAFDVVSLGRYAYGIRVGHLAGTDLEAVKESIAECDLTDLQDRRMDTLSGGEAARVHCARAFSTRSNFLLADEPTAALDPKHQLSVMQLIRNYVDADNGALVVAHEANLAARFADRLIWMKQGEIIADGSVEDTMTEDMIASVYGVRSNISQTGNQLNVQITDIL